MRSRQQTESNTLTEAAVTDLRRNDNADTMSIHSIDCLHFRHSSFQLFVQRNTGIKSHQVIDLSPGHTKIQVFKYRIGTMCDMSYLDLALIPGAGIRARELAERTFAGTNAWHNVAFQNNFSMSRNIQMLSSISFSNFSRNTILQGADEFIFILVVINRSACHKAYKRSISQSDSYR